MEAAGKERGVPEANQARRSAESAVGLIALLTAAMAIGFAPPSAAAQAKKPPLPYVTIEHPQFVTAAEAAFLSSQDLLIGVTDGKTSKAYPAAILAQHGVVQDRMDDGPIAVTW